MIQKLKNKLVILASILALAVPVMVPVAVHADANIQGNLCSGSNFDLSGGNNSACKTTTDTNSLQTLLKKIVNIISAIVGVVAVIMIVFGGFKYITSGGDSNNVSGAKNTIIYAIIGLVIVALAQLIVHFVLNQTSNLQ
jgi:cytochrome bd-type quinol oxidase subunit 2